MSAWTLCSCLAPQIETFINLLKAKHCCLVTSTVFWSSRTSRNRASAVRSVIDI